jgi:hypothetical protein
MIRSGSALRMTITGISQRPTTNHNCATKLLMPAYSPILKPTPVLRSLELTIRASDLAAAERALAALAEADLGDHPDLPPHPVHPDRPWREPARRGDATVRFACSDADQTPRSTPLVVDVVVEAGP